MTRNSEHDACAATERSLTALRYFFEASLDDARMVLRTAEAIVRDRERGSGDNSPAGKPTRRPARRRGKTPLSEAQVRDIRRRYQPGESARALAEQYGLHRDAIRKIACRRTWKMFPPAPDEYRQGIPAAAQTADTEPPESNGTETATAGVDQPPDAATPRDDSTPAGATETVAGPPPAAELADGNKPATPPEGRPRPNNGRPEPRPKTPQAKLTEEQVHEIRRRYEPGASTALAPEYGVDARTIRTIACRGSWKHLPPEPGEYLQADPPRAGTSAETAAAKPTPASQPETPPRDAAATTPKKTDAAEPAPPASSASTGAAPGTAPPKTPAPIQRNDGQARDKRKKRASKLTEAQVREIRQAYRPGGKTRALGKKYGVSASNILLIAQRRIWSHLEPRPGEYIPPAAEARKPTPAPPPVPAAEPTEPPPPPPPPRRHVSAPRTAPAARPKPATVRRPNGASRNGPQSGPIDHTAARINAERQRLSPESIRSIRERAADDIPPRRIARDFGISKETVLALTS
ncbi:MAG: hypothetical protein OXG72_10645 [Acidobacteria bacterium]|nr:hypothetical protein [Acidobacteriota bacterium]